MTRDMRDHPMFKETQHCTNRDCYTFSHTAQWCNREQPRFCMCPFDYSEGIKEMIEEEES